MRSVSRAIVALLCTIVAAATLASPGAAAYSKPIPANLRITATTATSLSLAWDAVAGAPGYRVQLSKSSSMTNSKYYHSTTNARTISGLTTNTKYYFRVSVVDADNVQRLSDYTQSPYPSAITKPTSLPIPTGLRSSLQKAESLTLEWNAVAGAPRYRIQIATASSMSGATYHSSSTNKAIVSGLKPATTYYFRVVVVDANNNLKLSDYTQAPYPSARTLAVGQPWIPQNLRAVSKTSNSLSLAWEDVPNAPRYRIQISPFADMSSAKYSSYVENEGVVTGLKPTTRYYFRVVVVDANDQAKLTDYTQSPYPSESTTAVPTTQDVSVGTFNIAGVDTDSEATKGGDHEFWAVRKTAVVGDIIESDVDVVGVQEANQAKMYGIKDPAGNIINQYTDLRNALNTTGRRFELTDTDAYNSCEGNNRGCTLADKGASNATRILYDVERLIMVDHGAFVYKNQYPGAVDRYLAWAVFDKNGKKFFFATTHLDPYSPVVRGAEWQEMIAQIKRLNTGNLPVLVGGDFNSTKYNMPAGDLLPAMKTAGFGDILNQEYQVNPPIGMRTTPLNGWINSFNGFRRDMLDNPATPNTNEGWTYSTAKHKVGNDVDYLFASNSLVVKQWKLMLDFDPVTYKVRGVIPSDHNMLKATVTLP